MESTTYSCKLFHDHSMTSMTINHMREWNWTLHQVKKKIWPEFKLPWLRTWKVEQIYKLQQGVGEIPPSLLYLQTNIPTNLRAVNRYFFLYSQYSHNYLSSCSGPNPMANCVGNVQIEHARSASTSDRFYSSSYHACHGHRTVPNREQVPDSPIIPQV